MHFAMMQVDVQRVARGFTLIETMIVLIVLAVLATVAVASYQNAIRKSRRSDAKLLLTDTAQRLERCFAECNSYTAASCPAPCPTLPVTSLEGNYAITAAGGSSIAATTFTLVATPVAGGPQAADSACTSYTLTHLNVRSATGSGAATCWQ
jgi:type IV pilus assembly protein PilE